jgi:hypothetical protein
MSQIHRVILKLAKTNPDFRQALAAALRSMVARKTIPPIQMKYQNLGDFGGTNRVMDSWILEVGGSTLRIKDTLSKLGLRWEPNNRVWRLDATSYAAGQYGRPAQIYAKAREKQEHAVKVLRPLIQAENELIEQENAAVLGVPSQKIDLKEMMEKMRRSQRVTQLLEKYGILVTYKFPSTYSSASEEATVFLSGETFDIKDILKGFGFRWDGSGRRWKIPYLEYQAVEKEFVPTLARELIAQHGKR